MNFKYKLKKKLIKLFSNFIINPQKRRRVRNILLKRLEKQQKKYKWGVSYSVFDGEELLEQSIKQIRKSVDYINVVYQDYSYRNERQNTGILDLLNRLQRGGGIDELIYYKPDEKLSGYENEIIKRNLGLNYAKKANVDYFMTMDVDEFYVREEFEKAKEVIVSKGITHSYCPLINYGLTPDKIDTRTIDCSIQFFCKIDKTSTCGENKNAIAVVDSTRTLSDIDKSKHYYLTNVRMHHMTIIRKDLYSKLLCSSGRTKEYDINARIENYKNNKTDYADVNDIFNLKDVIDTWK